MSEEEDKGPRDQEAEDGEAGSWEMSQDLQCFGTYRKKTFGVTSLLELSTATRRLIPCQCKPSMERVTYVSSHRVSFECVYFLCPFLYFLLGFPWCLQQQVSRGIQGREMMHSFVLNERDEVEGCSSFGTVLAQHAQSPKFDPSMVVLPVFGKQSRRIRNSTSSSTT